MIVTSDRSWCFFQKPLDLEFPMSVRMSDPFVAGLWAAQLGVELTPTAATESTSEAASVSTQAKAKKGLPHPDDPPAPRRPAAANALRHGLSGSGLLLPAAEAAQAELTEQALRLELRPRTALESILVRQMAVYDTKARQAGAMQIELRARLADRAARFWDDQCRIAAIEVAVNLADAPELVSSKLLLDRAGAEWIATRWQFLADAAHMHGDWTEDQRRLALDLMGLPQEFRESVASPFDGHPPEEHGCRLKELAVREMQRIHDLIESHLVPLDNRERTLAEMGLEPVDHPQLRLYRRYERDAQRRFEVAHREFRRIRGGGESSGSTKSTSTAKSAEGSSSAEFSSVSQILQEAASPIPPLTKRADEPVRDPKPPVLPVGPVPPPRETVVRPARPLESFETLESATTSAALKGNRRFRKAQLAQLRRQEKLEKRRSAVARG
jgi:hypothetical protein